MDDTLTQVPYFIKGAFHLICLGIRLELQLLLLLLQQKQVWFHYHACLEIVAYLEWLIELES